MSLFPIILVVTDNKLDSNKCNILVLNCESQTCLKKLVTVSVAGRKVAKLHVSSAILIRSNPFFFLSFHVPWPFFSVKIYDRDGSQLYTVKSPLNTVTVLLRVTDSQYQSQNRGLTDPDCPCCWQCWPGEWLSRQKAYESVQGDYTTVLPADEASPTSLYAKTGQNVHA